MGVDDPKSTATNPSSKIVTINVEVSKLTNVIWKLVVSIAKAYNIFWPSLTKVLNPCKFCVDNCELGTNTVKFVPSDWILYIP